MFISTSAFPTIEEKKGKEVANDLEILTYRKEVNENKTKIQDDIFENLDYLQGDNSLNSLKIYTPEEDSRVSKDKYVVITINGVVTRTVSFAKPKINLSLIHFLVVKSTLDLDSLSLQKMLHLRDVSRVRTIQKSSV